MGFWALMFPDREAQAKRAAEEAEIETLSSRRRDTLQVAQSGSRVMHTMAGAMQMMARGDNEDR